MQGMFAMLNQGIQNSPLAGATGQGMLDSVSMGLGGAAGALSNRDPYSFMSPTAKVKQAAKDIGQLDLTKSADMAKAAEYYGKAQMQEQQMAMATAAAEQQAKEAALAKEQAMITNLADRADKQGMSDMASAIRTGAHPDLKGAAADILKEERRQHAVERGKPGKRVIARQAGFSDEEIENQGLLDLDNEEFFKVIDGEKGTVKAFQNAAGEDVMHSTDEYGRVWVNGKRVRPEEAGLRQAPQKTQEVVSAADKLVQSATDLAADDFKELHESAKDAVKTLETTDRAIDRLNQGAATGFFAPVEITLGKIAGELGLAPEWAKEARNAEAYAATMGSEVATIIKDFGSGTGLSDADREYALKIAAGDVKVDEGVLRWLLNARRLVANNILSKHGDIMETLSDKGLDPTAFQILNTTTRAENTVPASSNSGTYDPASGTIVWN